MNSVSFINGNGSSGQAATGFDGYSALVAYYKASSAVSAYASIGNKVYFSLADAETDGVNLSYSDVTPATSAQTVTAVGTNGDVITITFVDWLSNTIVLGSYTKVSGDNSATLVATSIVAAINANTYATGFSATLGSTGAYTINAPASYGIYPNSKSVVNTLSAGATLAVTNNAFSGGTKSRLAIWHYQLSEYFRAQNSAPVYFSIKFDNSSTNTTTALFNAQLTADLIAVQSAFGSSGSYGQARQIAVLSNERAFATSTVDAIQASKVALDALLMNCSFVYVGDMSSLTLAQFPNLASLSDYGVSVLCSQSGSGFGLTLINTCGAVISSIGYLLGTVSSAAVSQNIAEVGAFNLSDGIENETPVFFDSAATSFTSIQTSATPSTLDAYRYIYMGKYPNKTGTYFNEDFTCIINTNQFFKISRMRVADKVKRGQYADLLPLLNSRFTLDANGNLSDNSKMAFSSAAYNTPFQMMANQPSGSPDLSFATETQVIPSITYTSSNGKINITTNLLPIGQAEGISVTIQYVTKYS